MPVHNKLRTLVVFGGFIHPKRFLMAVKVVMYLAICSLCYGLPEIAHTHTHTHTSIHVRFFRKTSSPTPFL